MTKRQAEDINKVFRLNNTQITKLRAELDSAKKPVPTKQVKATVLFHDTITVVDTLRVVDTIRSTFAVTDTTIPRLKGSVLLPKGDFWLYTFNEKTQRYELDPTTLEAKKAANAEKAQATIITVWSTTVLLLTFFIAFFGV